MLRIGNEWNLISKKFKSLERIVYNVIYLTIENEVLSQWCIHHSNLFQMFPRRPLQNSFEQFTYFSLFQVSFFIFITTIGLNIIFGIIVDTFSELRDLKVKVVFLLSPYRSFVWKTSVMPCGKPSANKKSQIWMMDQCWGVNHLSPCACWILTLKF